MQYLDYNEKKKHGSDSFPVAYYYVDASHPQYHMPFHWHMEYEIIHILKGEFVASLDQKEITAHAGDFLFIHEGVLHGGIPDNCEYQCLVFDLQMLRKANESCSLALRPLAHHDIFIFEHLKGNSRDNAQAIQLAKNLFASAADLSPTMPLMVSGHLFLLFSALLGEHLYVESAAQTPRNYKRILQLKNVLELIEQSYSSALTLDELAHAAGMNPRYFCRCFHNMTHRTPIDYLNHYRIERATHLLRTTDQSVLAISEAVGFNDLSYFIKTFRRYKGVTPRQMRR